MTTGVTFSSWAGHVDYKIDVEIQERVNASGSGGGGRREAEHEISAAYEQERAPRGQRAKHGRQGRSGVRQTVDAAGRDPCAGEGFQTHKKVVRLENRVRMKKFCLTKNKATKTL